MARRQISTTALATLLVLASITFFNFSSAKPAMAVVGVGQLQNAPTVQLGYHIIDTQGNLSKDWQNQIEVAARKAEQQMPGSKVVIWVGSAPTTRNGLLSLAKSNNVSPESDALLVFINLNSVGKDGKAPAIAWIVGGQVQGRLPSSIIERMMTERVGGKDSSNWAPTVLRMVQTLDAQAQESNKSIQAAQSEQHDFPWLLLFLVLGAGGVGIWWLFFRKNVPPSSGFSSEKSHNNGSNYTGTTNRYGQTVYPPLSTTSNSQPLHSTANREEGVSPTNTIGDYNTTGDVNPVDVYNQSGFNIGGDVDPVDDKTGFNIGGDVATNANLNSSTPSEETTFTSSAEEEPQDDNQDQ